MRLGGLVPVKQPFQLAPTTATALGNHTFIQPGVVADLSRLHFRPLSSMLIRVETCQYGRASAPGS